jgi:hypothetical protein
MKVVFVSFASFDDFTKLSRAVAVTIEELMLHGGLTHLTLEALDNFRLQNLLIQFVDSTKPTLSKNGFSLSVAKGLREAKDFADPVDTARVITLGGITFFPHKNFVKQAKADKIDVLEF